MNSFLSMGGYAVYVWSAYAIFFAVVLVDQFASTVEHRRQIRAIRLRSNRIRGVRAAKRGPLP